MGVIIIIVIAVFIGFVVFNAMMTAKRQKEIELWAISKGLIFNSAKKYGINSYYPQFSCLHQGAKQYAYNICRGEIQSRHIEAFDYHYETYSTNSKGHRQTHHHYFSAVIIESGLPLKPLFMRPERFFDKLAEFVGYDDIDFESAEFSRKFYVKANDKRWAYDVIHQRTMEFLLGMPQYTIQFGHNAVIAYRSTTFGVADFEAAFQVILGILERLPEYVVKQLKGN